MLLPSADNVAWILARWDAGTQAAFTAQMNTAARQLGMTHTHYTDPSGLSASTTSTAADQVRLGMAAMREPALAQIVALPGATIPVAGMVRNYNTLLGQDGITGLKTGSDTAAGGCILLAAWQHARGRDTLVVAAAFGQPGTLAAMLPNALQAGHQLMVALGRALAGQNAQHTGGKKAGKHPWTSRHTAGTPATSGGRVHDTPQQAVSRRPRLGRPAHIGVCAGDGGVEPPCGKRHAAFRDAWPSPLSACPAACSLRAASSALAPATMSQTTLSRACSRASPDQI